MTSRQPDTVSCIVPAYNAETYIEATLTSALAQTYGNLEVIVVDDGSTDGTSDIVAALARRDPRVRLIRQRNAGVAGARNAAIAASTGAFIAPLDADDLWHPEKIARQVAAMRAAGPRVGLVYCWSVSIDEHGRCRGLNPPHDPVGDVLHRLVLSNFIGCASVPLMRRAGLLDIGGYDPGLRRRQGQGCEDWKVHLGIAEKHQFALVPAYLVGYRLSPRSMSRNVPQMRRSHDLVLGELCRRHPDIPRRLIRHSNCRNSWWLARRALGQGDYAVGARLLLGALRIDPSLVLSPAFRDMLVRALLRGLTARRLGEASAISFPMLDPDNPALPPRPVTLSARSWL